MVLGSIARQTLAIGAVLVSAAAGASAQSRSTGVLILAHGGSAAWNEHVQHVAARVASCVPAQVAFGMATRATLQSGADRLSAAGVREIVAVPLFVSSHSSVIEATKFLLGVRPDAPPQLALFAKMSHDHGQGHVEAAGHAAEPVRSQVTIRMTSALDRHPVVAAILASRAREVSHDPKSEVAIVVAHGPEDDASNVKWLADMKAIADAVAAQLPFARVEFQTVRDDADPAIRERAAKELRTRVEQAASEKRTALIVPLLLSYGGIESGIRTRLDGLRYTMARGALLPDDRLAAWILESAGVACRP